MAQVSLAGGKFFLCKAFEICFSFLSCDGRSDDNSVTVLPVNGSSEAFSSSHLEGCKDTENFIKVAATRSWVKNCQLHGCLVQNDQNSSRHGQTGSANFLGVNHTELGDDFTGFVINDGEGQSLVV